MHILKDKLQIFITIIFLSFAGWQLSFQSVVRAQGLSVQWFGGTYGVVALIGACIGFFTAHKWGGFKTVLGKALMLFSLGLLAQELGQLIYTYYVYGAKTGIPYPSVGDIAYFGSVILYILAAVFLGKAAGVKFSLQRNVYKVVAIVIPAALLITSYAILLHHHQYDTHKPLTVLLDFGYPMGQATYISFAITAYLLSRRLLGGIMRAGISLIILALVVQYVSDFTFVYQNSHNLYVPGKFDDFFYLLAYFAMATALNKFRLIYVGLSKRAAGPAPEAAAPATGGTA
jgi:hypothetical protein